MIRRAQKMSYWKNNHGKYPWAKGFLWRWRARTRNISFLLATVRLMKWYQMKSKMKMIEFNPRKIKVPEYQALVSSLPELKTNQQFRKPFDRTKFDVNYCLDFHPQRAFLRVLNHYFAKSDSAPSHDELVPGDRLVPKDVNLWL